MSISRRATLAAVGVGLAGGALGVGGSVLADDDPEEIDSWEALDSIGDNEDDLQADYKLTENLTSEDDDYEGIGDDFEPIGDVEEIEPFTGTFDGNGHRIEGLEMGGLVGGLFVGIGDEGVVMNLRLENVDIDVEHDAGTIAVINSGSITDCFVSGSVNLTSPEFGAGGIAALVAGEGLIERCSAAVDVTATDSEGLVGGLCVLLRMELNLSVLLMTRSILPQWMSASIIHTRWVS